MTQQNNKKLTVKEFAEFMNNTDRSVAEEVYAKLLALRMEYEIDKETTFDPEAFEACFHIAIKTVKEAKLTTMQLATGTISQSNALQAIGFTRDHLLKLAVYNIA